MKKGLTLLCIILLCIFSFNLLVSCDVQNEVPLDPDNGFKEPQTPDEKDDPKTDFPTDALKLSCTNGFNTATAYFNAYYNENGLILEAYVKDSDLKSDIYYSYGYDDNVEYLIGTKYETSSGWDVGKTLHFLITADGDTFLQRANSKNTFDASYSLDLKCVFGQNYFYEYELTDYGYKTTAFFAYSLFGLTNDNRENLYVCPAMRNTHDYADTAWKPFREGGCNWNNACSFIEVDENGFVIDKSRETNILFLGDSQIDYGYWLTFESDIANKGIVNQASSGMKIEDIRRVVQAAAEYEPHNVVICAGTDQLSKDSAEDILNDYIELIDDLKRELPQSSIYILNIPGAGNQAFAEIIKDVNQGLTSIALETGITIIDCASVLSSDGMLLQRFRHSDGIHLNQMGYNLLSEVIRKEFDLSGGQSDKLTNGSMYSSTATVKDEGDFVILDGNYDRYTYFKDSGSENFYAQASFSAKSVKNGDEYPKFGIVISSATDTLFFYIDASNNFVTQKVGYVSYKSNNQWDWNGSVEKKQNISYSNNEFCSLSVLKYGDYIIMKVNGEIVFTLTGLESKGVSGKCDVGILSFNTSLSIIEPIYTTESLADYL